MSTFFGAEELWIKRSSDDEMEPVLLVGVYETSGESYSSEEDFLHSMEELGELAKACMMEPMGEITQQLPQVNVSLYVGSGKADEIKGAAEMVGAKRVIFNDTLSPSQMRNLQKLLELPITDRTGLILEIFSLRARTREAKIQVELARLQYLKPRLSGLWATQNRQGGASGAMSSKGEGEKQLELDRRTIDHRLSELRRELKSITKERETRRRKRQNANIPLVALVGYTNAGKSTIMNAMVDAYSADMRKEERKVFEANMLFATLDTTVRRICPSKGREFLLSDTVGFIDKLPTALVEAFKSTLEEATEADLLLQVVDGSDPHCLENIDVTKKTLLDLGAAHIPMLTVFNKSDLCDPPVEYPRSGLKETSIAGDRNDNVYISAREASSIEFLAAKITEKLNSGNIEVQLVIPYNKGDAASYLMQNGNVLSLEYTDNGTSLKVSCSKQVYETARKMMS